MKTLAHRRYLMAGESDHPGGGGVGAAVTSGRSPGPSLAPYDPLATNTSRALEPPSWDHWFGTDQVGRDIFVVLSSPHASIW